MGRDGADSDWAYENGYGNIMEGDIPSSWEEDVLDISSLYFSSFTEAKEWAKNNTDYSIVRSSSGSGFIVKQK